MRLEPRADRALVSLRLDEVSAEDLCKLRIASRIRRARLTPAQPTAAGTYQWTAVYSGTGYGWYTNSVNVGASVNDQASSIQWR